MEISSDIKNRERARWREKNRMAKAEFEALKNASLEDARAEGEAKAIDKVLHGILTAEATAGLTDDVIANLVGVSADVVAEVRRALSGRSGDR